MRWPFCSKRHIDLPDVETDRVASKDARRTAEAELEKIRSRGDEVSNASRTLRDVRERNHFAEMISEALAERAE